MTDTLLITGRGHSIESFDGWDDYSDIMAVSSGVFSIPVEIRDRLRHFCTMDRVKWFLYPLHNEEAAHAWQHDAKAEKWPFWADPHIAKHVPSDRSGSGKYLTLPAEVADVIPEEAKEAFQRELLAHLHLFGMQPGWGDYPNVHGWHMEMGHPPLFDHVGSIGMTAGDGGIIRNSWFMAVQVANRLGYTKLHFIGCDFNEDRFALCEQRAEEWYRSATEAGMEWINLSPTSVLGNFMPTRDMTGVLSP